MSEPTVERGPEAPAPRPRRSSTQRKRQQSVLTYIIILFLAAFLLLLLSLFMERRQNTEVIGGLTESMTGLRESVSAMQSVQSLYEENAQLKQEIQALQDQLEDQKAELQKAQEETAGLSLAQKNTAEAMDYFWQIDEAYVRGRYKLCRQLIEAVQEQNLTQYLPRESATDNDRFSPADRYQEIYDALY